MRLIAPGQRVWDADSCRARIGTLVGILFGSLDDYAGLYGKVVWDDGTMQTLDPRGLMATDAKPIWLEVAETQ